MALPALTLLAAQAAPVELSGADTAWMLVSTALVLLMTPALGFFYGGLVRSKNILNTLMMSFAALGVVGVLWALIGYSLAFAPGSAWIGGMGYAFLNGVGLEGGPAARIVELREEPFDAGIIGEPVRYCWKAHRGSRARGRSPPGGMPFHLR